MSKKGYDEVGKGDRETVNCPVCGQPMETRFDFLDGQRVLVLRCHKDTHRVRVEINPKGKAIE